MIKNIIFDMGGVLIKWNPEKLLTEVGLNEEDRAILFEKAFSCYKWNLLDAGYYSKEEDFLADILPDIPERLHEIITAIVMDFGNDFMTPMPKMADLLKRLKENGYKLFLLSNAGPRHHEYWTLIPGHEHFDGLMVSSLEKMYKPERKIYEHALKKFNLKAEESVFIDDLPINCAGALLAGITPINFKSPEKLIEELKKLGVNCN